MKPTLWSQVRDRVKTPDNEHFAAELSEAIRRAVHFPDMHFSSDDGFVNAIHAQIAKEQDIAMYRLGKAIKHAMNQLPLTREIK